MACTNEPMYSEVTERNIHAECSQKCEFFCDFKIGTVLLSSCDFEGVHVQCIHTYLATS